MSNQIQTLTEGRSGFSFRWPVDLAEYDLVDDISTHRCARQLSFSFCGTREHGPRSIPMFPLNGPALGLSLRQTQFLNRFKIR